LGILMCVPDGAASALLVTQSSVRRQMSRICDRSHGTDGSAFIGSGLPTNCYQSIGDLLATLKELGTPKKGRYERPEARSARAEERHDCFVVGCLHRRDG
jgi:hypothetical protein